MKVLISLFSIVILVAAQCPAKQIMINSSCLSCHYTCSDCSNLSSNSCTSCELEYFMDPSSSLCLPCPLNCRVCTNGLTCGSCNQGYYLNFNQTCLRCPAGTLSCTMSSIGLCLGGYYLSNKGYAHCVACADPNCEVCTNETLCSICRTGFLQANVCMPCNDTLCVICYENDFCQTCKPGYAADQYGKCNITCPQNCLSCVSDTICMKCNNKSYLSNYTCISGASVLCAQSSSPNSCDQCRESAYLSNTGSGCMIHYAVNGSGTQQYLTTINNVSSFSPYQLAYCSGLPVAVGNQITISQSILPSYYVNVVYQIYLSNAIFTLSSLYSNQTHTNAPSISTQSAQVCNGVNSVGYTSSNHFFVSPNYNSSATRFQFTFSGITGIGEVLVQTSLCGVARCQSCTTNQDCLACGYPYFLEINSCVQYCSFGYYTNNDDMTCYAHCPDAYYALRQQYLCIPCVSPCLTCNSSTYCITCTNNTFLLNGSCVNNCNDSTLYGNMLNQVCESCLYPCKTCSTLGSNCTSCIIGYMNSLNNSCTLQCPDTYYGDMISLRCQTCQAPCATCLITSSTCTSCLSGLSLNGQVCVSGCPPTTFTLKGICTKCQQPCEECSISQLNCTTCKRGNLLNNTCVARCPNGSYEENKICKTCDTACSVCFGGSRMNCTVCSQLYVLSAQSCITSCPDGTFNSTGVCTGCLSPCLNCLDSKKCTSCRSPLYLNGQSCVLSCPIGTYNMSYTCVSCPSSCGSCYFGTSTILCKNCTSGFFLENNTCNAECSPTNFKNLVELRCDPCRSPCFTCKTNAFDCLSCLTGFYLLQNTNICVSNCTKGYYLDGNMCKLCVSPCRQCSNSTSCTACLATYFLYSEQCLKSCPDTFYPNNNTLRCSVCVFPCKNCLSELVCTSCNSSSSYPFLFSFSCVNSCPVGSIGINSSCIPCAINCQSCTVNSTTCTSCIKGYFLMNSSCLVNCPDGYYQSSVINSCQTCKSLCKTCITYSYCTSCVADPKAFLFESTCVYSCPNKYFEDTLSSNKTYLCSVCASTCQQCSMTANNCTVCAAGTFMPVGVLYTNSCLSGCPALSYVFDSVCLACSSPCKQCTGPDLCISCLSNFIKLNQSCLLTCPNGYYNSSGECQLCDSSTSNCQQCTLSSSHCTKCTPNHYLYNNTCLLTCPSHYYKFTSTSSRLCVVCSQLCLQCSDTVTCLSCNITSKYWLLQNSSCVQKCAQGYYVSNNTCLSCSPMCVNCTNSTYCVSCTQSYLYNWACVVDCPGGTYEDPALICLNCISPCETCKQPQVCLTCIEGHFLHLTYCITKCPPNLWADRSIRRCVVQCSPGLFKNVQTMQCYTTCPLYYTSDGYCTKVCPSGQIINSTMGCQVCQNQGCATLTKYKTVYISYEGRLVIVAIFSQALHKYEVSNSLFAVAIFPKLFVEKETEVIVEKRLLAESNINILTANKYSFWLDCLATNTTLTSKAVTTLNKQTALLSNGYPVQNTQSDAQVKEYRHYDRDIVDSSRLMQTLSKAIGYIALLIVLINFLLDNLKATVYLTELIQIFYFLSYLQIWYSPSLQRFLFGFQLVTFRLSSNLLDFELLLWNSPPKNIYLSTDINFFRNCISTLVFLVAFIIICIIFRLFASRSDRLKKAKIKHQLVWNHINDAFWLFGFNLGLFAIFQLKDLTCVGCVIAAAVTIVAVISLLMSLGFVTIKCIYNKSFSERTFFWALDTENCKNSLSHMPIPLMLIRRLIVMFSVGAVSAQPLYCLFLTLIVNLLIISNIATNSPYKRHKWTILAVEVLFSVFIILMGAYTIFTTNEKQSILICWVLVVFIILIVVILLIVGIYETVLKIKTVKILSQQKDKGKTQQDLKIQDISKESESKDAVSIMNQNKSEGLSKRASKVVNEEPSDDHSQHQEKQNQSEKQNQKTPQSEKLPQINEDSAVNMLDHPNIFDSDAESNQFQCPAQFLFEIIKNPLNEAEEAKSQEQFTVAMQNTSRHRTLPPQYNKGNEPASSRLDYNLDELH